MARKRGWIMDDRGTVTCYRDESNKCKVTSFAQAQRLTSFHDQELAKATTELNSIISKIPKNKDPDLELSFLDTSEGLFLVWSRCIDKSTKASGQDEDEVIVKELGLKTSA
jgi:hypothetical protein